MTQQEREMIMQIKLKDQLKVCKLKLEMLKDGIKKERIEKQTLKKEGRDLKDKNNALQVEQKKKDQKYEQALAEIRELKGLLIVERNQKEKMIDQVNVLSQQLKEREREKQTGETPGGGWTGYFGGLLKR